ncbi:uncharacterized protein EDB93DRAFT_1254605 [Suillus bovinus]|uniref:uncharacterized protein n=1 Tax=Suillus bovinus TaxID=48563 RepID=UPI001B8861A5|nr:uncharacterized protein EDB93DRAFT_1254605 [Suillus bovinus]KAG2134173.1 hypothetical protein EDB93DRAFT_1254605 [Suillus bovinus]
MISTHPKNATQHPGDIVKQATKKRHTKKEIAADNEWIKEAQEEQQLATQNGINRVAEVEASMEMEQAVVIVKVIFVKLCLRLVKQKLCIAEDAPSMNCSTLGTQTSFQSKGDHTLKSTADNMGTDGDCELEMKSEAKLKRKKKENLLLCDAVSATMLKKQNKNLDRPDDLMEVDKPRRPIDGKAHGLDKKGKNIESKKFSLSGQINNWHDKVEPHSKRKFSKAASARSGRSIPCSTTDLRLTSVTSATTFSQAMEPPSTPSKTSKSLLKVTCSDDNNNDEDKDESDSEEHAATVAEKGKGKAAMKTVIEIDSGTDIELPEAPIAGNGKKTKLPPVQSLQDSDADDAVLSLPLTGTPFADLPYDRQLEIVSFALEQAPHTSKRKIEEVAGELGLQVKDDSVDYSVDEDDMMEFEDDTTEFRDTMELDSEFKNASLIAKKVKGTVDHTTTATSATAVKKPLVLQPAKKAKSEPANTQTLTTTKVLHLAKKVKSEPTSKTSTTPAVPTVPESMLADMAIKPVAGNDQWQNTDLPPMLTENGLWHRQFVPTVLLWAGSQLKFWTIEAADLLGPIMDMITQRLCTWHSNFGSTAIALIANFLASLRESEDEDEDKNENENENENTDRREKFMTQMAASLLKGFTFLFAVKSRSGLGSTECESLVLRDASMLRPKKQPKELP